MRRRALNLVCLAAMERDVTNGPAIEFRDVTYDLPNGQRVLACLNLIGQGGEIVVLLGRSGSGKTTTLKLINRLLTATSGEIFVEGKAAGAEDVVRLRRRIGYVIQEIGLFPHFTVERNIGLVPSIEDWPQEKIRARVVELLQMVGLDAQLASRYPHQLSGGQRQRVGVAPGAAGARPALCLVYSPGGV